jgi:putative mRNA 3-end processing factor
MALLEFTDRGIYCPIAGVYLDPWKPVERAIITHGHSDHARPGHQHYLCTESSRAILVHRLNLTEVQTLPYGQPLVISGVEFSFYPAGHIPGSAQIRVEYKGEVWVFTGDYKREADGISEPFEAVRCHTLITESTFGLPVYHWQPQEEIFDDINNWWRKNAAEGKASVITGYTLGKSQRILKHVDPSIGRIIVHGAVDVMNRVLEGHQLGLPPTHRITAESKRENYAGCLVVCPPSAVGSPWIRRFLPYSLGIASGWMSLRGARRRRGADRGFALSDHVDWRSLNNTVKETGADRVYVTHGYAEAFAKWLNENGIEGHAVRTAYEGELSEIVEGSVETQEAAGAEVAETGEPS